MSCGSLKLAVKRTPLKDEHSTHPAPRRLSCDSTDDAYLSSPNDYVMPAYKVETGAVPTSKKDLAAIAQQAKEREDANDQRCINIALAKTVKQQSKINKKKARADARDARIAGLEADLVKAKDKEGKGKGKAGEDICFRTALSALPQMCTRAGWDVALGTKLAPALFADFRSDERKSSKRKKTKVRDSLLAVTVAAERADIGFEGYWREATSGSTSAIGSGSAAAAAAGAAATAPMPPPSQSAGLLYLLPFSELCGGVDAFTRIVSSGVGIAQMASDMDTARVALVEADAERTRQKEKAAEEKAKKRRRRLLDVKVVKRNNLIPRVFCLPVVQQAIAHMVLEPRTLTLQSVPAATSGGGGGGGAAVTQPELFVNSSILIAMRDQLEEEELEGFRKILSKFSSEHLVLLGVHKLLVKEKKLPAKEEEELKHLDLGALFDLVYSAKAAGARSTRPRLLAAMKLAAKYPSSEGVGVSAAAKQIYSELVEGAETRAHCSLAYTHLSHVIQRKVMLTHTAEQRRARLRKALRKKGLSLRSDSSFCRAYINGTTNACVFKVVATMQITRELFRSGHIAWSNNVSIDRWGRWNQLHLMVLKHATILHTNSTRPGSAIWSGALQKVASRGGMLLKTCQRSSMTPMTTTQTAAASAGDVEARSRAISAGGIDVPR